ncbi:Peroxiredoxin-2E, chloroplastic [Linum grandiflorum]
MASSLSVSRIFLSSPSAVAATTKSFIPPVAASSRLSLPSRKPLNLQFNRSKFLTKRFSAKSSSTTVPTISASISVGDKLPDATLSYLDADNEVQTVTVSSLTAGKKAVLFAVPGAFTPTCSQKHLPGFVEKAAELKSKGVDTIACVSVNDVFVMKAWKENLGIKDEDVLLLSDGNVEFTKAIGCELDLSDKPVGLGVRSRRYALLAEDGVVKVLNLEEGGAFTSSGAEDMLKAL